MDPSQFSHRGSPQLHNYRAVNVPVPWSFGRFGESGGCLRGLSVHSGGLIGTRALSNDLSFPPLPPAEEDDDDGDPQSRRASDSDSESAAGPERSRDAAVSGLPDQQAAR